ncbi:MAG TPA: hypothetical protein GXX75_16450 [Clostridiales bacterium]|nr:hypothetical protein [Clostridiales bacterium]
MNFKVKKLINDKGDNYIFPFLWLHGEEEDVLRRYMQAIDENNIKAVCIESRPHPDYCGPKWWQDMDVILDEAKKLNMKVWILDDSHFPTGYANGAMAGQPDERCRQSICCRIYECAGGEKLRVEKEELLHPEPFQPSYIENYMIDQIVSRVFDDDKLLGIVAVRIDEDKNGFANEPYRIDLSDKVRDDTLTWEAPEGEWRIYALHLSRNLGFHRNYINMMDKESCKVLIDAVYEPHYAHYKEEFGKTIAGFFSDEPELGNGHLYEQGNVFGLKGDFPWSLELEEVLRKQYGDELIFKLPLLWEEEADDDKKAEVRYSYMNSVTRLVEEDFSFQIGIWCRGHGVQYVGHVIEDNNQHARTGSSLGHYYRGLAGQDMAGIDDIGGQVLPQGEELDKNDGIFDRRIGEFYHYMLGKLANSAAAIEPLKKGNSMCEIFGAYGWSEGLRLEKYLLDHFLVRGINHYVPHAYSAKAYPDPDCPPHFYADGNNPQHRHFGKLMAYTNRVCELISGGRHIAPVAVLYHGEGEWTGTCMYSHKVGHVLADAQIDYDYIPQDVFDQVEGFKTVVTKGLLKVNTQEYKTVIVPNVQYITKAFAEYTVKMVKNGIEVLFVDGLPKGICNVENASESAELISRIQTCPVVKLNETVRILKNNNCADITIEPADNRIRYYHYVHQDGSSVYLFVNEGSKPYQGFVKFNDAPGGYIYNAWDNCLEEAVFNGSELSVYIEPYKSLILVMDSSIEDLNEVKDFVRQPVTMTGEKLAFAGEWKRSLCRSIDYPNFRDEKIIRIPDHLAEEEPEFSGFVRYENNFIAEAGKKTIIEITDAHEGVEIFVNGQSFDIQIVPDYLFDITAAIKDGDNMLVIEVATTPEREMAKVPNAFMQIVEATGYTGITGDINIYQG